ncbi:hypothetical protein [Idiomarina sp.]|uniref:hypothetical protein n=1 Tax=Idiomarina sp. TaxID=1874361 RepID=UPI003A8D9AEB
MLVLLLGILTSCDIPAAEYVLHTLSVAVGGGICVVLVLQLPAGTEKDILLTLTYAVVVFFILVQGLSIGKVAKTLPINKGN